jgi:transcriptional regulator with XRE-family HTH domain
VNERLRTAMIRRGVTTDELAKCVGVDVKTIERWISKDRLPHRRHRWMAAARMGADETYLWPQLAGAHVRPGASQAELVMLYPDRASVPRETWLRLLGEAQSSIDVLVYSGTFYAQTHPSLRLSRVIGGTRV